MNANPLLIALFAVRQPIALNPERKYTAEGKTALLEITDGIRDRILTEDGVATNDYITQALYDKPEAAMMVIDAWFKELGFTLRLELAKMLGLP